MRACAGSINSRIVVIVAKPQVAKDNNGNQPVAPHKKATTKNATAPPMGEINRFQDSSVAFPQGRAVHTH